MIICGAGGHSLEVLDELKKCYELKEFEFYVDAEYRSAKTLESYPMLVGFEDLKQKLTEENLFFLGVGSPDLRERFFNTLQSLGGIYSPIRSVTAQVSENAFGLFDAMAFSFVGAKAKIGQGVLINVRAHVHHETEIGEFTEVGPGAIILGNAKIVKKCKIGAGSIILPGVQLEDEVTVGSGAVVTKNHIKGSKLIGIPAKPINLN